MATVYTFLLFKNSIERDPGQVKVLALDSDALALRAACDLLATAQGSAIIEAWAGQDRLFRIGDPRGEATPAQRQRAAVATE